MTTGPTFDEFTSIAVRPYQPGDEIQLAALFSRVFRRPITEAHWRWKLAGRPSPVEAVWLGIHEGRPIFQYAGIPIRVRLRDQEVAAMVSVDTMTDPDFQRRGLLTRIGRQCYDAWRAAGVSFVLGLPNERWGSRASALGWTDLFPFQWMVRPLRLGALAGRALPGPLGRVAALLSSPAGRLWIALWDRRARAASSVQVTEAASAGSEFDELWENCRLGWTITNVRDRAWVKWRYLDPPEGRYRVFVGWRESRPVGYAAFRLREGDRGAAGVLAEVFTSREDAQARGALLTDSLRRLYDAGASQAAALAVPGSQEWKTLRGAGFFPRPAFRLQVVPLDPDLPMALLRDNKNWCLAGGDFDVV